MVVFLAIIGAVIAIAVIVAFMNRFYRKSTRDVALVRTGFGGQKVVLSGGCLSLPFLHKVEEINMRTNRVEVKRTGDKSLITTDRIRVDGAQKAGQLTGITDASAFEVDHAVWS